MNEPGSVLYRPVDATRISPTDAALLNVVAVSETILTKLGQFVAPLQELPLQNHRSPESDQRYFATIPIQSDSSVYSAPVRSPHSAVTSKPFALSSLVIRCGV